MTTIQRTLSILAMAAFVGLACNTTDAMARGNNNQNHNSKQVVHVEKTVVKTVVKQAPQKDPTKHNHHKAPSRQVVKHVVHHSAPSPFGINISNGHVSVSLPGIHIN